jgi:phospholipid-transporting ATPase
VVRHSTSVSSSFRWLACFGTTYGNSKSHLGVRGQADESSYKRTYHPAPYHIVQEIQKFNLSDYRPRQEQ